MQRLRARRRRRAGDKEGKTEKSDGGGIGVFVDSLLLWCLCQSFYFRISFFSSCSFNFFLLHSKIQTLFRRPSSFSSLRQSTRVVHCAPCALGFAKPKIDALSKFSTLENPFLLKFCQEAHRRTQGYVQFSGYSVVFEMYGEALWHIELNWIHSCTGKTYHHNLASCIIHRYLV